MKISAVCILALWIYLTQAATQKGLLQCLRDGAEYKMVLVVHLNNDPVQIMYATNSAGTVDDNCKTGTSVLTQHETGPNKYYKVVVKWTTAAPGGFTTDDCSAVESTSTAGLFSWKFATRTRPEAQYSKLVFDGDMNYDASCNFATLQPNLDVSSSANATGTVQSTLPITEEDVSFSVVATDGETVVNTAQLGTNIRLRMTLRTQSNGATGISPKDCKACDTSQCTSSVPAYTLTDPRGCYVTNTHLGAVNTASFTGTDPHDVKTAAFVNFRFDGSSANVYFLCKIDFCYGTTTNDCTNRCSSQTGRRRRRDINTKKRTVVMGTALNITIPDDMLPAGFKKPHHKPHERDWKGKQCSSQTAFFAVITTLAVLLVMAVVASVAVYCSLQRSRHNTILPHKAA